MSHLPRLAPPPPVRGFPSEIKNAFDQLRADVIHLALKLTLFRSAFLTPENRGVLFDRTGDAFWLIEDSVAVDITISVARLMDPPGTGKHANLTLRYLFDLIEKHGNAPELLAQVQVRYQALDSILSSIKMMRDKVLAHRDRTAAIETPLNLNLTEDDIIRVCDEFKGIMNDVETYFERSSVLYDFHGATGSIPHLVTILNRGIVGMDEDLKKEWARHLPPTEGYGEVQ